jgi:hypothetical protein
MQKMKVLFMCFYLNELSTSIMDLFCKAYCQWRILPSDMERLWEHIRQGGQFLTGQWVFYLDSAQTHVSLSVERFWAKKKDGC